MVSLPLHDSVLVVLTENVTLDDCVGVIDLKE